MSITELKIYLDLSPKSKSKTLDKYAKKFDLSSYFFIDSEDGQCYLFDRYGKEKDVSLIHEINDYMILDDIKKIVIPNNVTSIGYKAFRSCSKLTSVTIGTGVTNIGTYAFSWCKRLTSMTIGRSVMSIKAGAFYSCSGLTSVTIPNNMTCIGEYAFYSCSGLTSVTIPNSVTSIGDWAFYSCNNLKSLVFKDKTIDQVKSMKYYPFGIKDKSVIKAEFS